MRISSATVIACAALVAGCYSGDVADRASAGSASAGSRDADGGLATGDAGGANRADDDGGAAPTGLPCDVDELLRSKCASCHGRSPSAPMPLVTYDDLFAPGKSDPSRKVAELALARMRDDAQPMPPAPSPRASASETAAMAAWIAAGYPRGDCGGAPADGGAAGSSSSSPQIVCTSGETWSSGDQKSPDMHPGRACITCHQTREDKTIVSVAGTVYGGFHEANDCFGIDGTQDEVQVVITDADGQELVLPVGPTGNFSDWRTETSVSFPIRAKVVRGGKERAMQTPQSTGDCNACHTPNGANGAPGRIAAP